MAVDLGMAIVLSLGCAVMGGPVVFSLLLDLAGQSSVADIAICVFLIFALTAPVLGTMLLARYFRVAAPPDPAEDLFARMTVAVALTIVLVVTACLLVIPSVNSAGGVARHVCAA